MIINNYAPVLIPTLDRYDKLKDCLESLERCTGSQFTDVFVVVDYPPSEKYQNGNEKIKEYLESKKDSHNFKSLNITYRERNYGICHRYSNYDVALDEMRLQYDRYIFSEDDNVFSPNFLEFLNKALERFKDDRRIIQVSGYNYQMIMPKMYQNNFYITKHGSPWGFGGWFDRIDEIRKYYDFDYLKTILLNKECYNKLKQERPSSIASVLDMLKKKQIYNDTCKGCMATLEDMYWILPTISKVQNHGVDGTGAHSRTRDAHMERFYNEQLIDTAADFDFTDDIFTYKPISTIDIHCKQNYLKNLAKSIITKIDMFCLKHFGFVPSYKYL